MLRRSLDWHKVLLASGMLVSLGACTQNPGALVGKAELLGLDAHHDIVIRLWGPVSASTTTDATGSYRFTDLPQGAYTVAATAPATREGTVAAAVTVSRGAPSQAPDLKLTPLGEIAGRASLGSPSGNAGIVVLAVGTGAWSRTDDAGHYLLRGVPAGPRELLATFPGRAAARAVGLLVPHGSQIVAPDLCVGPPAAGRAQVQGRTLLSGEPDHSGVLITLTGPVTVATVTDESGFYALSGLEEGDYLLSAVAEATLEGRRTVAVRLSEGEVTLAPDLVFSPVGEIGGRVVGVPLAEAPSVTVFLPGTSLRAHPDPEGGYVLSPVPTGSHRIAALAPGGEQALSEPLTVRRGQRTLASDLDLRPARAPGRIEGRVLLSGSSAPVGAVVTLSGPASGSAVTDETGGYAFSGLEDGIYIVTATVPSTAEGQVSLTAKVRDGGTTSAPDLILLPLGDVAGTVTRDDALADNAGILVFLPGTAIAARTDVSGRYRLEGVPVGLHTVEASFPGYRSARSDAVTVRHAETTEAPRLSLSHDPTPRVGPLTGIARLHGASEHSGIEVSVQGCGLRTETGSDGSFSLEGVPIGIHELGLRLGEYEDRVPSVVLLPVGPAVLLEDNALIPLPELVLPRARWVQAGRPARGEPISRDGARALVEDSGALYVVSLDHSRPPAFIASSYIAAFFSPDGSWVAFYSWDGAGNVVQSTGGLLRSLGPVRSLAFTPDSAQVVIARATGALAPSLFRAPLATTEVLELGPTTGDFTFSPDGQQIVFSVPEDSQRAGLACAPLAGGPTAILGHDVRTSSLSFSADSAFALFFSQYNEASGGTLFAAPLCRGEPRFLGSSVLHFAVAPTGDGVVFVSDRDASTGTGILRAARLSTGQVLSLATGVRSVEPHDFRISPDGSRILFWRQVNLATQTGTLQVMPLEGGPATPLAEEVLLQAHGFSPDSAQVFFYKASPGAPTGTAALYRVPISGGTPTLLTSRALLSRSWSFSPDGRWVSFASPHPTVSGTMALYLTPVSGGETIRLDEQGVDPLLFSPDGSQVVFLGSYLPSLDQGTLRVASLTGGSTWMVVSGVGRNRFTVSGNFEQVVFTTASETSGMYRLLLVPLSGGPATLLHPSADKPSLSPNGEHLTFQTDRIFGMVGQQWLARLRDGALTPLSASIQEAWWIGADRLLLWRALSLSPYRFQDGLYTVTAR
jgi:Tol biopolymer transport system component